MLVEILLLVLSLVLYFAYRMRKGLQHWEKLGIRSAKYQFPFGSNPVFNNDVICNRLNVNDGAIKQYKEFAGEKFYGTVIFNKPALMLCDPDLIKAILVKDFNHFIDRNSEDTNKIFSGRSKSDQVWARQMVNVSGETWKNLRSTFSPIFTSGKMKGMFAFIQDISKRLVSSFDEEAKKGSEFELKEKFGKFSMDTIASCAFGMDAQSFSNPKSEFVKHARAIFRRETADLFKFALVFTPGGFRILDFFRIPVFKPHETMFFFDAITTTLREREKSKGRRNDLIDMMLDAIRENSTEVSTKDVDQDMDQIELDSKLDHKANKSDIDELTIVATAMVMLVAGYDTTGQTLSYVGYELAKHPDIQKRLQDEIDDAIESSNGNLPDYTKTQSMEYLDMVFHETLRLHPAVGVINRACIKEYTLPGTNIVIKPGEEVFINTAGIHSDAKYYPEPEKFNPEHFSKEGKANRHPYAYLAFGQGPRSCIGMRFAVLEAKMALIALLSKYTLLRCSKTVETVTLDPASALGACKDGLYIKIEARS